MHVCRQQKNCEMELSGSSILVDFSLLVFMATLQNSHHTHHLLTLQRRHGRQLDAIVALQVLPLMLSFSKQVNLHARSLVLTSARLYINEAHLWSDFTPSRFKMLSPTAPDSLFVWFLRFFFFFSFGEDSLPLGSSQKSFPLLSSAARYSLGPGSKGPWLINL